MTQLISDGLIPVGEALLQLYDKQTTAASVHNDVVRSNGNGANANINTLDNPCLVSYGTDKLDVDDGKCDSTSLHDQQYYSSFKDGWNSTITALSEMTGTRGKQLFRPLRVVLTGRASGPELSTQMQLLAQAERIKTLGYGLDRNSTLLHKEEVVTPSVAGGVAMSLSTSSSNDGILSPPLASTSKSLPLLSPEREARRLRFSKEKGVPTNSNTTTTTTVSPIAALVPMHDRMVRLKNMIDMLKKEHS